MRRWAGLLVVFLLGIVAGCSIHKRFVEQMWSAAMGEPSGVASDEKHDNDNRD